MRCIDLLVGPSLGSVMGPSLAKRGPVPVRLIQRIEDVASEAILVVDSAECSLADCSRLSAEGVDVVVMSDHPAALTERAYADAGAAAYVAMIVDDRLIEVLDRLAG